VVLPVEIGWGAKGKRRHDFLWRLFFQCDFLKSSRIRLLSWPKPGARRQRPPRSAESLPGYAIKQ
jgi:hypothetical protein